MKSIKLKNLVVVMEKKEKMKDFIDDFGINFNRKMVYLKSDKEVYLEKSILGKFKQYLDALTKTDSQGFNLGHISVRKFNNNNNNNNKKKKKYLKFNGKKVSVKDLYRLIRVTDHML